MGSSSMQYRQATAWQPQQAARPAIVPSLSQQRQSEQAEAAKVGDTAAWKRSCW